MALFIKRKSDGEEFADKTHVYGGGIVCAFEVSTGVYCPIIVYDDAVSISGDKLEVQTPKPISELYWAYSDTFVADPTINPNLTGTLAYPILLSTTPDKYYTTANSPTSTTTFKILLDNPNNWQVQFSTNVEGTGGVAGGVDSGGYPVGWANISKETAGHYLVRTISHNTLQQTVWIRYRRSGDTGYPTDPIYRIGPNFTPMPIFGNGGSGGGGGGTPIGGTNAVEPYGANDGVPLLAHVWGMMGNEGITEQGTYQDDILAIENLAKVSGIGDEAFKCLPWYAVRNASPTQYQTSVWNAGTDTGNKRTSEIYYSFALTKPIMKLYVEYAVRAGIQGFMMLNYRNDAYLSLFRRVFRTLDYATEMRGIKICYSLNFGGGADSDSYATDLINGTWPNGTTYRDTIYQFAEDIVQPWYATARKMVGSGGAAVQVPIVHCLISQAGTAETDAKNQAWLDLQRIKDRVAVNGGSLTHTFNILMTSGPDISSGSADATGDTWNATTQYYLQPSGAFSGAGAILDANMGATGVAAANKVPMISWGYDSRPRWYFQHGDVPSYFPYGDVTTYMPTLIDKLKVHMDDAPKDLRVALCGQVGEYAEQGRDLFPSFVVNSAPSTTMLDIFKAKFNAGYVIPT